MAAYIAAEREGSYILDFWNGTDPNDWHTRSAAPVDVFPDTFDTGDVVEIDGSIRSWHEDFPPDVEYADESVADTITDEYDKFRQRLEAYAEEYDVALETQRDSLADGDVILVATPPGNTHYTVRENDTAFICHDEIFSNGEEFGRDLANLINCRPSVLTWGMAFDVFEIDEYVFGLRFNQELTETECEKPGLVHFFDLSRSDLPDDLEEPLYVNIDGFDDGQYYSSLYDCTDNPSEIGYKHYREIATGSAFPPSRINEGWAKKDLVPVTDLYFNGDDHPEAPVAVISREAEAIEVERQ